MRHWHVLAMPAAVAAALCILALPTAAEAASGITISSAGNPAGQPSVLNVSASDSLSTGITSMTAQLTPAGGGTAYAPPALTLASGSDTDGIWTVTIPSGAIAAGNYTISVTATDASGPVTDADAGTLAYLYQPTLTATSDVSSVTYGAQTVTFSGQLTAVPPGGGTPVDEGGVSIFWAPAGASPTLLATTASDGSYTMSVPDVLANTWTMTADATSTVAAAQSNQVTITESSQQANLNNLVVTPNLKVGETATLTGVVNYGFGTGVVSGADVQVTDGSVTLPTVTTNSSGVFTISFPAADGEMLQITAGANVPLITPTSIGLSFNVLAPLKARLFTAKLEGDGFLVSGICILTSPPNFNQFDPNSVELQYAPTSHGPWRNLGALPAAPDDEGPRSCQSGGWSYYTDSQNPFGARLVNSYYRVSVPGNVAIEPYTSPVVHSSLNLSRIVSFSVNTRSVREGSRLTFSGTLERRVGRKWLAYSGQRVYVLVKEKGQKAFQGYIVYGRTSRSGHFSAGFKAGSFRGRLVFAALFDGSSKYLWSLSSQVTVAFNGGAIPAGLRLGDIASMLAPTAIPGTYAPLP